MCPEYGAILSFFPVDNVTLKHLKHTGKDEIKIVIHCNSVLGTWQYIFGLKLHSYYTGIFLQSSGVDLMYKILLYSNRLCHGIYLAATFIL